MDTPRAIVHIEAAGPRAKPLSGTVVFDGARLVFYDFPEPHPLSCSRATAHSTGILPVMADGDHLWQTIARQQSIRILAARVQRFCAFLHLTLPPRHARLKGPWADGLALSRSARAGYR